MKKALIFESTKRLLEARNKLHYGFDNKTCPIENQTKEKGHPGMLVAVATRLLYAATFGLCVAKVPYHT